MLSIIKSITLHGLEGFIVDVQVDVAGGIPCCDIVGLPDISIRESKERVRAAIKNSGFEFPSRRIVINLAPATIKKEGSAFDLPIAIAILMANGYIKISDCKETVFLGELSLDGNINSVKGILPMCIESKRLGIKKIIVPKDNVKEASIVTGIEVIPVTSLNQVVSYLNGQISISAKQFNFENICENNVNCNLDFSEVKGQKNIKRAIEVAASGGHNCLLIGSPRLRKNYDGKKNSYYFT